MKKKISNLRKAWYVMAVIVVGAIIWGIVWNVQRNKDIIKPGERISQTEIQNDNTLDRDLTQVRHQYRIALERGDGTIFIGYQARKRLNWNKWPDHSFNLPVLDSLPPRWILDQTVTPYQVVLNPDYDFVTQIRGVKIQELVQDLQVDYPQLDFVLLAYNPQLEWFKVPDQWGSRETEQWMGFIDRSKYYLDETHYDRWEAIKKLIK